MSLTGRFRACVCQRSRVSFWTCHREYLWGLCPSRSDGGTGSQFGRSTDSTTTSTPSWKVLFVLEEKQNYGKNAHLYNRVTSKSAILSCLDCVTTSNWVTPHWRSRSVYSIVCVGMPHSQHVSVLLVCVSAHFSANSFLRTWQRCSWLCGGKWRRTDRGWTLTTPRSDVLRLDIPSWGRKKVSP